jgi:hypothetical protein
MPAGPTPAQSAPSRVNGALSHGPSTPEGKARSAVNATRHGLRAASRSALPPDDAAELAIFRDALTARLAPVDAVEEHWVAEIAFALWQQQRLRPLAALALAAESGTDEPETSRLPSLATLARYRARIERDLKLARQSLDAARQSRPRLPSRPTAADAARIRWLAGRIEERLHESPPADDTGEPEPAPATSFCTSEPGPAPAAARTSEPEHPRPLNRRERRRLLVLGRKAATAGPMPPAGAVEAVVRG